MKKSERENIVFLKDYKKNKDIFNINDEFYIDEIVNHIIMEQEQHTEEYIKDILSKKKNR